MSAFLGVLFAVGGLCVTAVAASAPALVPVATDTQPTATATTSSAPSASTTSAATATSDVNSQYTVVLNSGSLKDIVTRVAKEMGWKTIVWKVPFDYEWVGTVTLHGNSVSDIFTQMLSGYPVQAIFYQGNRVLLIIPRTLNNDTNQ